MHLPQEVDWIGVPPVKCQGIKTKLVPFIFRSLVWNPGDAGRWIEPFLGSGVVTLNLCPERAIVADTNEHIIRLYRAIYDDQVNPMTVRDHLERHGKLLQAGGAGYYYEVRERFNQNGSSLDFLFLNRSCFNGIMRFNRKGKFNVPFGHKPERFSKAYITKIVNQVAWVSRRIDGREWHFLHQPVQDTLAAAKPGDFVYLDPPYIGRHTDYYGAWTDSDAAALARSAIGLPCGFAASMWLENRYRKNAHIVDCWPGVEVRTCSHFYHVGSTENLRSSMDEALLIRPGFATADAGKQHTRPSRDLGNSQRVLLFEDLEGLAQTTPATSGTA